MPGTQISPLPLTLLPPACNDADTLLIGARAIAGHLGITQRQAQHLIDTDRLPVIRMGSRLCARPTTLDVRLAEHESRSLDGVAFALPMPGGKLLYGLRSIGLYIGMTRAQVQHHVAAGRLPVFRLGDVVCARARTVDAYLAKLESDGMKGEPPAGT